MLGDRVSGSDAARDLDLLVLGVAGDPDDLHAVHQRSRNIQRIRGRDEHHVGECSTRAELSFNDHYLEVDYDLSNVMFITTANTLNIPGPLMDRMEIIRIAGYTENEKVEIARKHLIPNAISKHGLDSKEWSIDDDALLLMIRVTPAKRACVILNVSFQHLPARR